MGLKYIEQVKSVILLLLILLSFTLTFTIWTYSPSYNTNDTPIVDISIAEKKKMEDVIKPYRLLYSQEDSLSGSINMLDIEAVLSSMKNWEIQDVELINNQATMLQLNDYIKTPNRITFFFPEAVPIETYSSILTFADDHLPDASFNRLVIGWNELSGVKLYFISTIKQKVYSASVHKVDTARFSRSMMNQSMNLKMYNEIERPGDLSLYVSSSMEDTVSYKYYIKEITTEKFKNALFNNPSLVKGNPLGGNGQEYTDDNALMNVDFLSMALSYVHPAAESENVGNPATLLQNSLNFINEHNGWTDDYRFSRINPNTQQITYQLYFSGLPVFSQDTATEISLQWGENKVYRYRRPYHTLNVALPLNTRDVQLPSGQEMYNFLSTSTELKISSVDEILPGYNLSRDDNQPLFNLEPAWYFLSHGLWIRITPELLGGGKFGLE